MFFVFPRLHSLSLLPLAGRDKEQRRRAGPIPVVLATGSALGVLGVEGPEA